MSMLYEDQKRVLITIDSIIRSVPEDYSRSPSRERLLEKEHPKKENTYRNRTSEALFMELEGLAEQNATQPQEGSSQPVKINLKSEGTGKNTIRLQSSLED